jgi:2-oxoisovalerate dehydrogenase E2 component (dihydrolipoyl transacylase)
MLKSEAIDPAEITGTGKGGRITREDVQKHKGKTSKPNTTSPAPVSSSSGNHSSSAKDRPHSLNHVEKHMFRVMTDSLKIPHFLFTHDLDIASLNTARKRFNLKSAQFSSDEVKLTILPFIMKAVSQAFLRHQKLNSHLQVSKTSGEAEVILRGSHNFGVAMDTEHGLLTPVVRDVQNHSVVSLASEISRLGKLAHDGKLLPGDFQDATFLVSNVGSISGSVVAPVIVPPMVGILGIGTLQEKPIFVTNERGRERIVKSQQMTLSWSADHRVIDGATVAKTGKLVQSYMENIESFGMMLK